MQFDEMRFPDALPVDSYGPGFFRVGGRVHHGPLLILPDAGVLPWSGWEGSTSTRLLISSGYAAANTRLVSPP